jgi:hypothetical protein
MDFPVYQHLEVINDYDWNIWFDDGVFHITASELIMDENGEQPIGTNHEHFISLDFPNDGTPENTAIISHFLDGEEPYDGFDAWVAKEDILYDGVPEIIREFVDGLGYYEYATGHDYEMVSDEALPIERLMRCRVCGDEYRVERVSR